MSTETTSASAEIVSVACTVVSPVLVNLALSIDSTAKAEVAERTRRELKVIAMHFFIIESLLVSEFS
ncbi:hypothetical protein D3C87_2027050 [compost metagenome]